MRYTPLRARAISRPALLLAGCGMIACGEVAGTIPVAPTPASPPSLADLSPEQRALLATPVAAEALLERRATQQELQAFRNRFAPGQLETLLAVANRRAAARGEDTIPHCVPLCAHVQAPQR